MLSEFTLKVEFFRRGDLGEKTHGFGLFYSYISTFFTSSFLIKCIILTLKLLALAILDIGNSKIQIAEDF